MNWDIVKLGDLTSLISSGSTPLGGSDNYLTEGTVMFIRSQNVHMNLLVLDDVAYISDEIHHAMKRTWVYPGDVLLNITGASIGRVSAFELENTVANVNQHVCIIRPKPELLYARYLSHFLSTSQFQKHIDEMQHGGTRQALTFSQIANFEIPLPPLAEQQRIAAILDQADALRTKRRAALAKLDTLLQATFLHMFGDPVTNPKRWGFQSLSKYFSKAKEGTKCGPFGSALKKHEYVESGIPVWIMDNIQEMKFQPQGSLYITPAKYEQLRSYSVIAEDIIISRAGTVGKMCVVEFEGTSSIISSNLIRLSLDSSLLDPYYFVSLMTFCKGRVGRLKTGEEGAYSFMNTGVLSKLNIPVPPIEIQKTYRQFLHRVQFEKNQHELFLADLDNLFHSLQQRAFKGEL